MSTPLAKSWIILIEAISNHEVIRVLAVFLSRWSKIEGLKAKFYAVTTGHGDYPSAFHAGLMTGSAIKSSTQAAKQDIVICIGVVKWIASLCKKNKKDKSEFIEGNGYEGRQTSKGELFVKVPLF